jgi:hypothetical protein
LWQCKACIKNPPGKPEENPIYRGVNKADLLEGQKKILEKLNKILTLMGSTDKEDKPQGYSKKCQTCGNIFVTQAPATRYCDNCKDKK